MAVRGWCSAFQKYGALSISNLKSQMILKKKKLNFLKRWILDPFKRVPDWFGLLDAMLVLEERLGGKPLKETERERGSIDKSSSWTK